MTEDNGPEVKSKAKAKFIERTAKGLPRMGGALEG
jgi:hypothetical protein